MGIFRADKAVERIEDRLVKLETLCDDLQRTSRSLELEYVELFDKVKRQMSRMAKRYAVDTAEVNDAPVVEEPDDGLDPISRSILRRRGMARSQL